MNETDNLYKTKKVDGGVAITGVDASSLGAAVDLVIPSIIDGLPVIEIACSAFKGCSTITSVDIAESVKMIGVEAFHYCFSLSRVIISKGVQTICNNAFSGCSSLESVAIPDSVQTVGDLAFSYCPSLRQIEIPKSVKELGKNVFEGCSIKIRCYERSAAERWVKENNVDYEIVFSNAETNKSSESSEKHSCERNPTGQDINLEQSELYDEELYKTEETKGGVAITGLDRVKAEDCKKLVIPSNIGGKKVVKIGDNAFKDCSSLTNVVIPDSVKEIGDEAFSNCYSLTSVVIPESVRKIGNYAFADCFSLINVVIPEGVEEIAHGAFSGSSALIEVAPNNSTYSSENGVLFDKNKEKLLHVPDNEIFESYSIPENVKEICDMAFESCSSLTNVVIPEGVKKISNGAFAYCSSLTSVMIPNSIEEIDSHAFYDCNILIEVAPDNSRYSSENGVLFDKNKEKLLHVPNNESFEMYSIPESVKEIGASAFSGCSSLKSLVIPMGVTKISNYAFASCMSLTNVVIPESVRKIGKGVFSCCTSLSSVVIPNSVKSMSAYAFDDCHAQLLVFKNSYAERWVRVKKVVYEIVCSNDETSTSSEIGEKSSCERNLIGQDINLEQSELYDEVYDTEEIKGGVAITGLDPVVAEDCKKLIVPSSIGGKSVVKIDDFAFKDCSSLTNVVIPNSVQSIGDSVFSNCSSLTSVVIPNSVQSIGDSVFWGCSSLTSVVIPDSVQTIGSWAFSWCASLTSVVIPDGVQSIGRCAFWSCSSLKGVVIPNSVQSIGNDAFSICPITLQVHRASYAEKWAKENKVNYEIIH
ncbi:MAG: leucine-rich repeat domain-containing protein [Thermoguttaceae bacterium]|nr:leucine-rich repeat domain-containing protein [Thermoguttaceae bacterium]